MWRYILPVGGVIAALSLLALAPLPATPSEITSREKAIISQASQRDWPVVVIGDSVTELAAISTICGKPALNAGVSGRQASGVEAVASAILKATKPDLVVIAVGKNDAWADNPTPSDDFHASMRRIIDLAGDAQVVLVKPGKVANFGKADTFDNDRIALVGDWLATLGPATVGPMTRLTRQTSDDGVHPNAAGYRQWFANLESACGDHAVTNAPVRARPRLATPVSASAASSRMPLSSGWIVSDEKPALKV